MLNMSDLKRNYRVVKASDAGTGLVEVEIFKISQQYFIYCHIWCLNFSIVLPLVLSFYVPQFGDFFFLRFFFCVVFVFVFLVFFLREDCGTLWILCIFFK